jgi:hypothetical protein
MAKSEKAYEIVDYTEAKEGTHYDGVGSWYGKHVNKQLSQQPRYCEPGEPEENMKAPHRNVQIGPKI